MHNIIEMRVSQLTLALQIDTAIENKNYSINVHMVHFSTICLQYIAKPKSICYFSDQDIDLIYLSIVWFDFTLICTRQTTVIIVEFARGI